MPLRTVIHNSTKNQLKKFKTKIFQLEVTLVTISQTVATSLRLSTMSSLQAFGICYQNMLKLETRSFSIARTKTASTFKICTTFAQNIEMTLSSRFYLFRPRKVISLGHL